MQTTKRTETGIPTLSWCIIARNAEATIEATLKSIRERTPQAEIVVVDTCSSDSTPEIAQRYADTFVEYKGPRGDWDKDMIAFDDASAARQHSFELATGRWRGWIDADDRIAGPEEAERLLRLNNQWEPEDPKAEVVEGTDTPMSLEEILHLVDEYYPEENQCIYAPYLYQRDEHDRSVVWQVRERIVKWSDNWKWMEKSHEVLLPVDANFGHRHDFTKLLFVHEKVHSEESNRYALERHFRVLNEQYLAGEVTSRRCLYLAQYAKVLCPQRQAEFIDAAHRVSTTRLDRYRAKMAEAEYFIESGLYVDSREALAAAVELIPDLPDAWVIGGTAAMQAEDWTRAEKWLGEAVSLPTFNPSSLVNPRLLAVTYRVMLAAVYSKMAEMHIEHGDFNGADELFDKGTAQLGAAMASESIGPDREPTAAAFRQLLNAQRGNKIAINIAKQARYLVDNDEPAKVLDLIAAAPHTIEDHPIIVELEKWSRRIEKHLTDDAAYKAFYLESEANGIQVASPDCLIHSDSPASRGWVGRAYWAAEIIARECPKGTILDIGCYDGLSAIPILELCPDVKYVGVDLNESAAQRLRDRFELAGFSDRATVLVNDRADADEFLADLVRERDGEFDIALWFEVIEHVAEVDTFLLSIMSAVKPGGQLLISTPWGAFDDGAPANALERDERGHVRAMTPRNFYEEMKDCDLDVVQLYRNETPIKNGADTLHAAVRWSGCMESPVAFAVYGALWNWNSTTVHNGGFGASEETICYMAENLAADRETNVFGPVPEEEVRGLVGYWPKVQLRHVDPHTRIVVSRAPRWGAEAIDELCGFEAEKYLWLQDAVYPDLTPEVAEKYRKIVCVGEWQMGMMHRNHGVPMEKMEVIGNFLMPQHFEVENPPERERHHFIYASSPDRGLINLLKLWPEVLNLYPDATLDIFYGWRGMFKLGSGVGGAGDAWTARFESVRRQYNALRHQKGVQERGMVPHAQIARELMRASAWTYPTEFTETFCSTAVKARAAGCVPVTTGLAALNETAVCDQSIVIPFDETKRLDLDTYGPQWLAGLQQAVETSDAERKAMAAKAIEDYSIGVMADKWRNLLD